MSDEESTSRTSPIPEKCFYASFKIFLNPESRKNSNSGSESLDDLMNGAGEVIRIEKTLEVSDDNTSDEDDKTLSLSNGNVVDDAMKELSEGTDNDEKSELRISTETLPPLVVVESLSERKIKRSVSESEDIQSSSRSSRSTERHGSSRRRESRYESTQSMDRYHRDRSPVFYLNPQDWVRTGGTSPLPYKEKAPNPMKLLDSLGKNLDILSESEENINSELELINFETENVKTRTMSDPVRYQTPSLQLIKESSSTPEPQTTPSVSRSCTPGIRSRSSTPGPVLGKSILDRQRKTAIPILCSRSARIADCITPQPVIPLSPSPRPLDQENIGFFHGSRPGSSCGRGRSYRSLSNLGKLSQEDLNKGRFSGGHYAFSSGNLFNLGELRLHDSMHPIADESLVPRFYLHENNSEIKNLSLFLIFLEQKTI